MSLYHVAVPTLQRTLTALSGILGKAAAYAETKEIEETVLVNARLAPDMHPLKQQIKMLTDTAGRAVGQLTGVEITPAEGDEETIADLQVRIQSTLKFLEQLTEAQFEGAEDRIVELPLPDGVLKLDGTTFLMGFAMANFSFHVVTTYNILRHNGVDIGKMDYLGSPA